MYKKHSILRMRGQNEKGSMEEGMIAGYCKIRKRGCSSPSSSSSVVLHNYRLKRGAGGAGACAGGSNYSPMRPPVSARKLAATLWEMNDIPSSTSSPSLTHHHHHHLRLNHNHNGNDKLSKKSLRVAKSVRSASLVPPHLSDPSHTPTPVSQRIHHSGSATRTPSISQKTHTLPLLDSATLMEIESSRCRSRGQTPSRSILPLKPRCWKDVSNALTTSKELLKIINRMWARHDPPSSITSLVSALHAELERARLLVNQLIHEHPSDHSDVNYLIKSFAQEKAAWKMKEQQVIDSVAAELEVEKKLRRRLESFNNKLGRELADTKALLINAVKELDREKRAREVMEHVCDELSRDLDDDKADVEGMMRDSANIHQEVDKERGMLQLADMLREERVQVKHLEAKQQFEDKNAVVDKLRGQLESILKTSRPKEKGRGTINHGNDEETTSYLRSRIDLVSHQSEGKEKDGEVEDGVDCEGDSAESDLHSIELNNLKSYISAYSSVAACDSNRVPIDAEIKGRSSNCGKAPRRSTCLQRSVSDGVESIHNSGQDGFYESERQAQRKGYGDDDMPRYKSKKGLRDQILLSSSSRIGSARDFASPTRQLGQLRNIVQERPGTGSKLSTAEARGEFHNSRKSMR